MLSRLRLLYFTLLFCFGLDLCVTEYFQIVKRKQVTSTFETLSSKTLLGCAAACLQNAQTSGACAASNFNSAIQTCGLSDSNGLESDLVDVDDDQAMVLVPLHSPNCPTPNPLTHGIFSLFRDTVTYTCNPGYFLIGSSILTCVGGSWQGTTPTCILECGLFPFSNLEIVDHPSCTYEGCTLGAQCKSGLKQPPGSEGLIQMTCSSGNWIWSSLVSDCSYELMFRGTAENGYNINAAYLNGSVLDGVTSDETCMDVHDTSCTLHYRNSRIDSWDTLGITEILYEMYSGGSTVLSIVFDGTGSSMDNWMGDDVAFKAVTWPWADMTPSTTSWWSLFNNIDIGRSFRILYNYANCNDYYYSVVLFEPTMGCYYEAHSTWPRFLYSDTTGYLNFNTQDYKQATSMAVWVKMIQS